MYGWHVRTDDCLTSYQVYQDKDAHLFSLHFVLSYNVSASLFL